MDQLENRTRRAQVVLPAEEYALLQAFAEERGTTISGLVREVLERTLVVTLRQRGQDQAMSRLFGQDLPIADWPEIERDLEAMWAAHAES